MGYIRFPTDKSRIVPSQMAPPTESLFLANTLEMKLGLSLPDRPL